MQMIHISKPVFFLFLLFPFGPPKEIHTHLIFFQWGS